MKEDSSVWPTLDQRFVQCSMLVCNYILCVGQIIPKGLHVRLNIQTGETEAKVMSEEDSSRSREPAGNILQVIIES